MIENNLKEAIKLIIEKKLKKMSEASGVQAIEGGQKPPPVRGATVDFDEGEEVSESSEINELDSEFLGTLPDNSNESETLEEEAKCCGEANCVERGLHPPGQPEKMKMVAEELNEEKCCGEANCVERGLHPPGQPEKMKMVAEELDESKIITPEQEESFHNRLFGARLVSLNAKLMSNFIKK